MKTSILLLPTFLFLAFLAGCTPQDSDNTGDDGTTGAPLNKIVLTTNGTDTVMNIFKIQVSEHAATYYLAANQSLMVVSAAPEIGRQVDCYVSDTTIRVGKKYPIKDPWQISKLGYASAYIRTYTPVMQTRYATISDEDSYFLVSKLEGNTIQGSICFKIDAVNYQVAFNTNQLIR